MYCWLCENQAFCEVHDPERFALTSAKMVQCSGHNKSGRQCERKVWEVDGTECWQHRPQVEKPTEIVTITVENTRGHETVKVVGAHEYTCDSCGRYFLVPVDEPDGPPLGYHGNVFWHHEHGGGGCNFFVCNGCVQKNKVDKGIDDALSRAWNS